MAGVGQESDNGSKRLASWHYRHCTDPYRPTKGRRAWGSPATCGGQCGSIAPLLSAHCPRSSSSCSI